MKRILNLLLKNRSLRQTVIKNTFWLTVANVVGRAIRVLLVIYSARVLEAAGFGVFSYALGFTALFIGLGELGINGIINRNISRQSGQEEKTIASGFFIKIALGGLTYIAIIIASFFFTTITAARPLIPIIGAALLIDGLREFCFGVVRAFQKMEMEALITVIAQIFNVLIGFLLLVLWKTPLALAAAYLIGSFLGAGLVFYYLRPYFQNLRANFDASLARSIIYDAWPFGAIVFGNVLLLYTDTIFLGWLKTDADVGYYNAAAKPLQIFGLIPNLFIISLFPTIARRVATITAKPIIEKAFSLMMLCALPIAIGGALLPQLVIGTIFGAGYAPAVPVFRLLILMAIFNFPGAIFGYTMLAHNQQAKAIKYIIGSAALNIFLNYFFIRRWGMIGAAAATVIAQAVGTVGTIRETWKLERIAVLPNLWRPTLATAVMAALIIFLQVLTVSPWIILPAAILIYIGSLAVVREPLLKETLAIARNQFSPVADLKP